MKYIKINTEFITLGQLLKYINVIESGAHAKIYLTNNIVLVNGVSENRRGRKLYPDDVIDLSKTKYIIEKDL